MHPQLGRHLMVVLESEYEGYEIFLKQWWFWKILDRCGLFDLSFRVVWFSIQEFWCICEDGNDNPKYKDSELSFTRKLSSKRWDVTHLGYKYWISDICSLESSLGKVASERCRDVMWCRLVMCAQECPIQLIDICICNYPCKLWRGLNMWLYCSCIFNDITLCITIIARAYTVPHIIIHTMWLDAFPNHRSSDTWSPLQRTASGLMSRFQSLDVRCPRCNDIPISFHIISQKEHLWGRNWLLVWIILLLWKFENHIKNGDFNLLYVIYQSIQNIFTETHARCPSPLN